MEHRLKTWPVFFHDVATGAKTFEIRKRDRNYCAGDLLILEEYDPNLNTPSKYTGERIAVRVTYAVVLDGIPGIPDGFIGMSIEHCR